MVYISNCTYNYLYDIVLYMYLLCLLSVRSGVLTLHLRRQELAEQSE